MTHNSKYDACFTRIAITVKLLKLKEKVRKIIKTILLEQKVKNKVFADLIKGVKYMLDVLFV